MFLILAVGSAFPGSDRSGALRHPLPEAGTGVAGSDLGSEAANRAVGARHPRGGRCGQNGCISCGGVVALAPSDASAELAETLSVGDRPT